MPFPIGAHYVSGHRGSVRLANGDVVTEHRAKVLGAADYGYGSNREYLSHRAQDRNYVNAVLNTEQGQRMRERNQELGRSDAELRQKLIAARNDRPHPGSGKSGGQAYQDFMSDYEYEDYEPFEFDY